MKGEVKSDHFLSDSKKITEISLHMVRLRTSWWGGLWVLKPTDQKSDNKIPKCAGGGGRAELSFFCSQVGRGSVKQFPGCALSYFSLIFVVEQIQVTRVS